MNYIEQFTTGAEIGRGLAASVGFEIFAQGMYQEFITTPERAPTSPVSAHLYQAAIGAGAIASGLASSTGIDRNLAVSVAVTATITAALSQDHDAILEPLASVGGTIFAVQIAYMAGSCLYNGAQALAGRVRNWMG